MLSTSAATTWKHTHTFSGDLAELQCDRLLSSALDYICLSLFFLSLRPQSLKHGGHLPPPGHIPRVVVGHTHGS